MELVTATVFSAGAGPGAVFADQVLLQPRLGLLAVADAHGAGEDGRAGVRIALDAVRSHVERNEDILQRFRRTPSADLRDRLLQILDEGISRAAQEVFAYARRRPHVKITLDVLLLLDHEAFVAHVGDGRVYLVRRGLVHQLTVDHSLGDEVIVFDAPAGPDAPTNLASPPPELRATRALGPQPRVRVESLCMELSAEDRFVVCSHHLHRSLPEAVLHSRLTGEHLAAIEGALTADLSGRAGLAACAQLGSGEPFTPDSALARLAILKPMPLFQTCTDRELRAVAQATRPRRFQADTILFEQGHPGAELFLLISGRVDIVRDGNVIATLGPGTSFGEMAMLDEPNRSASAVCTLDTELMVIPKDAFYAMLRGNPVLAAKILWNMLLRLSANLRRTSQKLAALEQ